MPGKGGERRALDRARASAWPTAVAKALSHPMRLDILQALETEPRSPSAIAASTSHNLPKLAYHVRELMTAGLVKASGSRPVRGAIEHFYELTDRGRAAIKAADAVMALDPEPKRSGRGRRRA